MRRDGTGTLLSVWLSILSNAGHKEQLRLNGHACVMEINAALRAGDTIDPFCRNQLYAKAGIVVRLADGQPCESAYNHGE